MLSDRSDRIYGIGAGYDYDNTVTISPFAPPFSQKIFKMPIGPGLVKLAAGFLDYSDSLSKEV